MPVIPIPGFGKPVLLWTNSDPTATFAAQTIPLDLSDYNAILYYTRNTLSTLNSLIPTVCLKGETTYVGIWHPTNNRNGMRLVTPSDTGVTVSACTYNGGTQNTYDVPYYIYGLKW